MTRDCTCTGTCYGAAGLGEGWQCVLEKHRFDRSEPETGSMPDPDFAAFCRTYIHESTRPDCLPDRRWRATMSDGTMRWFATQEEAVTMLWILLGGRFTFTAEAPNGGSR